MALIISPIRSLVKTTLSLAGKIISGGFVWFGSRKVNDKLEELEKKYYPAEEKPEQEKPVKRRRRKRENDKSDYCDDRR